MFILIYTGFIQVLIKVPQKGLVILNLNSCKTHTLKTPYYV